MKFLIVTGLSGAGKTCVLRHLEDNGYHIIQCRAGVGLTAIGDYYAAGICFPGAYATPFQAYKDGEFIELNEAYEAGLVSKEAIEKAGGTAVILGSDAE